MNIEYCFSIHIVLVCNNSFQFLFQFLYNEFQFSFSSYKLEILVLVQFFQFSFQYKLICILQGMFKGFSSAITTIMCQVVVIELWCGSYRMLKVRSYRMLRVVIEWQHIDTFHQRKPFVCLIKLMCFSFIVKCGFETVSEVYYIATMNGLKCATVNSLQQPIYN